MANDDCSVRAQPTLLFTENETNTRRLYGDQDGARYVKDSFHDYVVQGEKDAVNPDQVGTKAAAHYVCLLAPGATKTIRLRFTNDEQSTGVYRAGLRCGVYRTHSGSQ